MVGKNRSSEDFSPWDVAWMSVLCLALHFVVVVKGGHVRVTTAALRRMSSMMNFFFFLLSTSPSLRTFVPLSPLYIYIHLLITVHTAFYCSLLFPLQLLSASVDSLYLLLFQQPLILYTLITILLSAEHRQRIVCLVQFCQPWQCLLTKAQRDYQLGPITYSFSLASIDYHPWQRPSLWADRYFGFSLFLYVSRLSLCG